MLERVLCGLLILVATLEAGWAGPVGAGLKALESQPFAATAQVVEVRGERGDPEPPEWVFLLADSKARGGVREVTLANGKILSERTPLRGILRAIGLEPLDVKAMSVDAEEVFRIAHKEAVKAALGFDWLDYALRTDPRTKVPMWDVRLYNKMGAAVGSVRISAVDGTVEGGFQAEPGARARAEATPVSKEGGLLGSVGQTLGRAAKSTQDSTLQFIGTLQEEVVGERTIGPKENE